MNNKVLEVKELTKDTFSVFGNVTKLNCEEYYSAEDIEITIDW